MIGRSVTAEAASGTITGIAEGLGATGALLIGADALRETGEHAWAVGLDLARLALYWFWFRLTWRCSRNVRHAWWTAAARSALLAGLALTALA